MPRKTKMMLEVEHKLGEPLEHTIPRLVNESGITHAAQQMGVSKATVNYWMLKLGIRVQRIAITPGEEITVKRTA